MKFHCACASLLLAIFPGGAATPLEDLKAAIDRLAEQSNYSWTTAVNSAQSASATEGDGQRQRRPGGGRGSFAPPSGKTEKGGFTLLRYQTSSNSTDFVVKGSKVAVQIGDEWQTSEELEDAGEDGGFNRLRFTVRRAQTAKLPHAEALDLANGVERLEKNGDVYTGELKPAAIKEMYTFRGGRRGGGGSSGSGGGAGTGSGGGRDSAGGGNRGDRSGRGGGFAPDTSKLRGTARFWEKNGILTKFEYLIEGKMAFGRDSDRETDVKRTTIFEIKDIGTTKLELPAEARKKLNKA